MRGRFSLFTAILVACSSLASQAADHQQLVNTMRRAGQAYWQQRGQVEHPDGTYAVFAGEQTVTGPGQPQPRYYNTDSGWVQQPHIFMEQENSPGHAGVLYAYTRAYEATGDKFFLRAAKALGHSLLSAQADNGSGGWWYDMGVLGYDRQPGSPTYKQVLDYGRWVNYFPWGGQANVMDNYQNIGSFDGVSFLAGLALLRLYQVMPSDDTSRDQFFNGAQQLADTIVGFKDVTETGQSSSYQPYGQGGIPQVFPWATLRARQGVDVSAGYPYDIPHNLMVTLNDDAMVNALFFLIEFWQESTNRPELNSDSYLAAIRLNIDYLLDVFALNANEHGRGSWSSQYWINDGSARAGRPTWGRAMEPPSVGFFAESGDELLVKWHNLETDATRKGRIADTLTAFLLFWKNDAVPVNSSPELRALLANSPYWQEKMNNYDPHDLTTWWWWLFYDTGPGTAGSTTAFVSASSKVTDNNQTLYTVYHGLEALELGHYNTSGYPMIRSIANRILVALEEQEGQPARVKLYQADNQRHNWAVDHYFVQNTDARFFTRTLVPSESRAEQALAAFQPDSGFFSPSSRTLAEQSYTIISDALFTNYMCYLAWAAKDNPHTISDSDGDGLSDAEEQAAGSDPFDSESLQLATPVIEQMYSRQ